MTVLREKILGKSRGTPCPPMNIQSILLVLLVVLMLTLDPVYCDDGDQLVEEHSHPATAGGNLLSPRNSRNLVAAVAADKATLRLIAPSIGSKAGTPAWTTTGDPCLDLWKGVYCDRFGYVSQISFQSIALSGKINTHMIV